MGRESGSDQAWFLQGSRAFGGSWRGPETQVRVSLLAGTPPTRRMGCTFSSLVSLLSRKFTYCARLPPFSLSALMQLPRASRERLMWAPSFILLPRFWVWAGEERSGPGRVLAHPSRAWTAPMATGGDEAEPRAYAHRDYKLFVK